ncbi:MAG: LysR substrate-binding domain-containing protein [Terriglobia bacterium]
MPPLDFLGCTVRLKTSNIPQMELRHLRSFVAVAEELNFTRAAKRLHTAQPWLSQQIIQLEESVGTKLLERSKHEVKVTAAGRVFLRDCREILHKIDQSVELAVKVAHAEVGELSVGLSPPAEVLVMPRLSAIMNEVPGATAQLHCMSTPQQVAALRKYTIDVGFLRGPVEEPDLVSEEILREGIVVVLPAKHRLTKMKRVSVRMLRELPCITISRNAGWPLRDIVSSLYKQADLHVRAAQEADGVYGHLNMVAAGLGFALLPEYVKSILPRGVVTKPLEWQPIPSISLVAAYRANDELPILGAFLKVLRRHLGKTLQQPS